MNKLVRIPGIVISASVLSSRATKLHLQCRACRSTKVIYPSGGLGGLGAGADRGLPRVCDAPEPEGQKKDCPLDPYLIIHNKSTFSDHQTLKLQEAPDMVPVGELPRHILLSADRYTTGQVVPGSRVVATGIYSTFHSSKNVSDGLYFHCRTNAEHSSEICRRICASYPIPATCPSRTLVAIFIGFRWSQSIRTAVYTRRRRGIRRNGEKRRLLRAVREERGPQHLR